MSKQDNDVPSVTRSDLEEHKQELRDLLGHSLYNTVQIGGYTYALYLEHDTEEEKRLGKHNGNVTALYLDNGAYTCDTGRAIPDTCYEAASGIYFAPDSPCQSTSVSVAWLRDCCRPIREAKAREIHPRLFEYLEGEEESDPGNQFVAGNTVMRNDGVVGTIQEGVHFTGSTYLYHLTLPDGTTTNAFEDELRLAHV